jgi:hypothetical protein
VLILKHSVEDALLESYTETRSIRLLLSIEKRMSHFLLKLAVKMAIFRDIHFSKISSLLDYLPQFHKFE